MLPVARATAQWKSLSLRTVSSAVVARSCRSRQRVSSSRSLLVRRMAARRAAGTSKQRRTSLRSEAECWPTETSNLVTLEATKVPLPGRDSVRPRARRRPRASRTICRLTPKRRDSSASAGSRSFTCRCPNSMSVTSCERTSSTAVRRTTRCRVSTSGSGPVEPPRNLSVRLSDSCTVRLWHRRPQHAMRGWVWTGNPP